MNGTHASLVPAAARLVLGACLLCWLGLPSTVRGHDFPENQIARATDQIRDDPQNAQLYLYRGELHRLSGHDRAARRDYDAALAQDPGLLAVWLARAQLELDEARFPQALSAIEAYEVHVPADAAALRLRALALEGQGRPAEAIDAWTGYLRDHPDDQDALHRRTSLQGSAGTSAVVGARASTAQEAPEPIGLAPDAEPMRTATIQVWIHAGSTWKFDDGGVDLGTAWREAAYDDSAWSSGPGILGYGEAYINTPVDYGPDANDKHRTTYFRLDFDLTQDPASLLRLSLAANFDDGFIAFLNGTEVLRVGLPSGTVTYDTFASSHESGAYEVHDISAFTDLLVPGANVFAVEVHQTSSSSSDLAWDMELTSSDDPALLLRGPYLQMGTPTSMVLRWRTDVPTESVVLYSTLPAFPTHEVVIPQLTTEHEVLLTGLFPGTRYYYSVGTTDFVLAGNDVDHSFWTSPAPGSSRPVRIWAIGDSGLVGPAQRAVRDAYLGYDPGAPTDVWLMLGDNAYNTGTDTEYQGAVFDAYADILRNTVLWPTRGNHDNVFGGPDNDYYDIFTLPTAAEAGGIASMTEAYYSFDYAQVHFVCLDSQGSNRLLGSPMLDWLQDDLDANARPWVIAFWHHPPYTKGSHDSDTESQLIQMRENAAVVLENAGVDLVLTGHSHSYERSMLLHGHYGVSSTLQASNQIDDGDGSIQGDGAYQKVTDEGAVYAVVGSSSRLGGGSLDHPAMITSLDELGSLVVDVNGNQLDGVFLDDTGAPRDDFTIVKSFPAAATAPASRAADLRSYPNPFSFRARLAFRTPRAGNVRLDVYDLAGRRVANVLAERREAGSHVAVWDGRDARGGEVSAGTYVGRLSLDGQVVQTRKIVLVR